MGTTARITTVRRRESSLRQAVRATPWLLPAGLLIFGVVLFPAGYLVYDSTRDIGLAGVDQGSRGGRTIGSS